jgi:hypothetical protein
MKSGRVELAPDYRLITEVVLECPICGNPDCAEAEEFKAKIITAQIERARLEREVIEGAKKWVGFYNGSSLFFSDTKLANVINELLEFESKQK